MKKDIKYEGRSLSVEFKEDQQIDIIIDWKENPNWKADQPKDSKEEKLIPVTEKQPRHLIVGSIDGQEKSIRVLNVEEPDIVSLMHSMEDEIMQMVDLEEKKKNQGLMKVTPFNHIKSKLAAKG